MLFYSFIILHIYITPYFDTLLCDSSKVRPKAKDGWDSQAEDVSSADEKKTGLKSFIKQLPRRNTLRRSAKDPKGSLDRDSKTKPPHLRDQTEVRNYLFC